MNTLPGMVTRIRPRQPKRSFLKAWREHRGLTQEQLADRIGTNKAQISNWENARRAMGWDVQCALAEALSIEPEDLFRDPERPSADELLRGASPEIRDQVMDIIKLMVKRA